MLKIIPKMLSWFDFKTLRTPQQYKYLAVEEFDLKHTEYPRLVLSDSLQEIEKHLSEQVQKEDRNYLVFELKDCLTVKSSTIVTKCEKC